MCKIKPRNICRQSTITVPDSICTQLPLRNRKHFIVRMLSFSVSDRRTSRF